MIFALILGAVAILLYLLKLNYDYWITRGVPGPKPIFLLGNLAPCFFLRKSTAQVYEDIYNAYRNTPIVGIYRAVSPTLVVCDPEIIKEVNVKSFNHFHDNDLVIDKKVDPLFGRNPFVLRGEEWKTTRQRLTAGFSNGKMKSVYRLLETTSKQMVQFINKQINNGDAYEAKKLCEKFALSNVGNYAFGLDAKCFEEEDSELKQLVDKYLSPNAFQVYKVFLLNIIPVLGNFISFKFTPNDVEAKLLHIIKQTLEYRESENIVSNDYLHHLQQIKKMSKDEEFNDLDITAHASGFLLDGYETSSIVMGFILYELAANPEVQSKLREEINTAFEENNEELPYEVLQNLHYLDGVFNEALRLYPPIGILDRVCTKSYTYTPKTGDIIKKPVIIEAGTTLIFPMSGLQRDSRYFTEPNSFKPERFIGENKVKFTKYAFLPFGVGPRTCLGKRFASLQVKTGIAHIVKNFEISVNKKTKIPIRFNPVYFMTVARDGLWLNFKNISNFKNCFCTRYEK